MSKRKAAQDAGTKALAECPEQGQCLDCGRDYPGILDHCTYCGEVQKGRAMREKRLAWLRAHRDYFVGRPSATIGNKEIVEQMKAAGLYSKKTMWCDVRIEDLITEARWPLAGKKWKPKAV